ncbi:NTP transferase domain-containing protein [Spirosoma sp. KUDC1026]|uniref:nucleotidyltransferase family protein n=1 Tax=Spirosoma sp. KUDC1026 TaxID=2745947 RepID=UPI00159BDB21|nr:nucleotidyltransferase family protein [Spirosoma sp. KUDC1026]QKZ11597.1 nucleotidyltransferase family protein [Spirosoma sp. KUDC1026]
MPIATIILAAGGSTRLGQPKQLLAIDQTTLIRHMAQQALALEAGPVTVVLGGNQEQIQPELDQLPVHVAPNTNWQSGLASSIQTGLQSLQSSSFDAFLILLTDQPYVTTKLLQQLIDTYWQTGRGIVACRYGDTGPLGVPALFARRYEAEFAELTGDIGARKLIQHYQNDCADVLFPQANIDLDTWDDVAHWRNSNLKP